MTNYRRNRVPGGTYFFTVNLLDRRSGLLVQHVQRLRGAVRQVRAQAPFHIDAWVVLPEHLQVVSQFEICVPICSPGGPVSPGRTARK